MSEALKVTTRTIDRELAVLRKLGYIKQGKQRQQKFMASIEKTLSLRE